MNIAWPRVPQLAYRSQSPPLIPVIDQSSRHQRRSAGRYRSMERGYRLMTTECRVTGVVHGFILMGDGSLCRWAGTTGAGWSILGVACCPRAREEDGVRQVKPFRRA